MRTLEAGIVSVLFVALQGAVLSAQWEEYPLPAFPRLMNLARQEGSVTVRITSQATRVISTELISFQFYENRLSRQPDGSARKRRKLEVYPPYFKQSIEDALKRWSLPNLELSFEVTFQFELSAEAPRQDPQESTRLEALIKYQDVGPPGNQVSVPGFVSVKVTRLGPEVHIDQFEIRKKPNQRNE